MTTLPMQPTSLQCVKCGAETNPEYHYTADGERHPVWQCLNIDCLHLER